MLRASQCQHRFMHAKQDKPAEMHYGEEADKLGPSHFEQVRNCLLEGESSVKVRWEPLLYSFGILQTQILFSKVLCTNAVSCTLCLPGQTLRAGFSPSNFCPHIQTVLDHLPT